MYQFIPFPQSNRGIFRDTGPHMGKIDLSKVPEVNICVVSIGRKTGTLRIFGSIRRIMRAAEGIYARAELWVVQRYVAYDSRIIHFVLKKVGRQ